MLLLGGWTYSQPNTPTTPIVLETDPFALTATMRDIYFPSLSASYMRERLSVDPLYEYKPKPPGEFVPPPDETTQYIVPAPLAHIKADF